MHQLDCQCEPADEEGHFACDCWATQDPEPAQYLDCLDAQRKGQNESGVYTIQPNDLEPFEVRLYVETITFIITEKSKWTSSLALQVYCDMENDGGGWTVFQRRVDGSVDFYRNWQNYTHGFGSLEGEHWLGLSKLYRLANASVPNELQVDMGDFEGNTAYAKYSSFAIDGSLHDYQLHVSGYTGTAGNSLSYHNGRKFTTKDNDNDGYSLNNCAIIDTGAWWYYSCSLSNPNGVYGNYTEGNGIIWYTWKGFDYALKHIQFKIRKP